MSSEVGPPRYALGHSAPELERLRVQARLVDPITRRFLLEAGIAPGMRVLDVGSGAGDVAFLVAELVGDAGEVVGTDLVTETVRRLGADPLLGIKIHQVFVAAG